jgi:hypothetical protein
MFFFGSRIKSMDYFGGVTLMRKEHFIKINGYSNIFFGNLNFRKFKTLLVKSLFYLGWGGEGN